MKEGRIWKGITAGVVGVGLSVSPLSAEGTSEYNSETLAYRTPAVTIFNRPVNSHELKLPIDNAKRVPSLDKESHSVFTSMEGKFQRVYDRFAGMSAIEITQSNGRPAVIFFWDQTPDDSRLSSKPTNVELKSAGFQVDETLKIQRILIGQDKDYKKKIEDFYKKHNLNKGIADEFYDSLFTGNKYAIDVLGTDQDAYFTVSLSDINRKK